MEDPFDILGLPPTMDLARPELEARYLELSRESHPDFQSQSDPASMTAVLARSASINDAYRALRDPWRRARALAERLDPGVLDRTKQLCPATLLEAMEIAEAVESTHIEDAAALEGRIRSAVDARLERVSRAFAAGDAEAAATAIHEARYYQKALDDLRDRGDLA